MGGTLYISDLDGTLLDKGGNLTQFTKSTINRMIREGHLFTIATARTLQSAQDLIYYLGLKLPAVLNNGATIYDPVSAGYVEVHTIPLTALPQVLWALDNSGLCGFLYTLKEGVITIYYQYLRNEWDNMYHDHRVDRYNGRIYQRDDLIEAARDCEPVCMVTYGLLPQIEAARDGIASLHAITTETYNDGYTGYYFMDIFPSTASKAKGMLRLQAVTGADRLVAFGDNFNDLAMLLAADYAYVPKNAVLAAQNIATNILDYAHRDGVAHFLAKELGWE